MKVLLLAPQVPWPPRQGTALRNFNVALQLARRHDVTVLAFGDRVWPDDPLRSAGVRVVAVPTPPPRTMSRRLVDLATDGVPDLARRLASAAMQRAVACELATSADARPPDVVQIEGLEMAPYGLTVRRMAGSRGPRLIYDAHNAEWVLQDRAWRTDLTRCAGWHGAAYSALQTVKLRRFERHLVGACDGVVAVSRADAGALRALVPAARIEVVPNGVDTDEYAPADPANAQAGLCSFSGKMDFRPNIDAMAWFVSAVWPLVLARCATARLEIVGRNPSGRVTALESGSVRVVGEVDDVRPCLARASVVVAPLRIGGGTRLKVLEAMAMAKAVAATSLAVEGLDLAPGQEVAVADDPSELANAVSELLTDAALRERLGDRARRRVVADYQWQQLVPRIEQLYAPVPGLAGVR